MSLIDKIKNRMQMAKGRGKEETGRVTRDRDLEAEGRGDRAAGSAKQVGERIKDMGKDIRDGFKR